MCVHFITLQNGILHVYSLKINATLHNRPPIVASCKICWMNCHLHTSAFDWLHCSAEQVIFLGFILVRIAMSLKVNHLKHPKCDHLDIQNIPTSLNKIHSNFKLLKSETFLKTFLSHWWQITTSNAKSRLHIFALKSRFPNPSTVSTNSEVHKKIQ